VRVFALSWQRDRALSHTAPDGATPPSPPEPWAHDQTGDFKRDWRRRFFIVLTGELPRICYYRDVEVRCVVLLLVLLLCCVSAAAGGAAVCCCCCC
jgi:hypothetical protein